MDLGGKRLQHLFMISMISVLMGQFYISPAGTPFRLTLAVFFMSLFLVYFEEENPLFITLSVGISTFLFRSMVFSLGSGSTFASAVVTYLPVLSYYLLFGLLFMGLGVRRHFHQPFSFFMTLWVCDTVPNVVEALLRRTWLAVPFDELIITIALVGAMRTIMTLFSYYLGRYYVGKSKSADREKHYRELILFISRLKTELFLLKKSRQDIEATMAYAHDCYEESRDERTRGTLLKIAKEIHEIKKDYLRVIAGMDAVFRMDAETKFMSMEDILAVVRDNVLRLAEERHLYLTVERTIETNLITQEYYPLISVLNNLTVNSMEAMEGQGHLEIEAREGKDHLLLRVTDNGKGIAPEKQELIFKAGYTSKYDPETGKMSTGLGLSHVKNLVEDYFGGQITLESVEGRGSTIKILLPKASLIEGGGGHEEPADH